MTETTRTTATRLAQRVSSDDWGAIAALMLDVPVAHVGFVDHSGQPFVIPIAVATDGADVLLHGSTGSRWLRAICDGAAISLAVTALDGLVVARSAFESSMHYRSAVLFGHCRPISGPEKLAALDVLTDALIPGRVAEVRRPSIKEIAATLVLRMTVEDFTLKVSNGWPEDPESDVAGTAWAGVIPMRPVYSAPLPAPDLASGVPLPLSVLQLRS